MLNELHQFYDKLTEPNQSCFLALRKIIMDFDSEISEEWKYRLPFFHYKKKPFCYIWKDKKTSEPYIGIVRCENINHPNLIAGNRKKMKIFPVIATEDIDVKSIYNIFEQAEKLY